MLVQLQLKLGRLLSNPGLLLSGIIFSSAFTLCLLSYSQVAYARDSITFGGNFDRQRSNVDQYLPPAEPAWSNDQVSQSITQPVVIGDKIYHASARWLWELPLADGSNGREKRLFEIDTGETATTGSHPTYFDNVIYVGSKNGYIYAYDLEKGAKIRARKAAGEYGVVSSPLVMRDSAGRINVVVGSSDGEAINIFRNFHSSNEQDVQQIENKPGGNITASPSRVNEKVFVFATNYNGIKKPGKIVFYDLDEGKAVWTLAARDGIPSSVAVTGTLAFAADKSGNLYALDFQTKCLKWSNQDYASEGTFVNFSPAVAKGKVFFPIRRTNKYGALGNGILTAWDQQNGSKLWASTGIQGEITTSPIVWEAGNVVLVGTSTGLIYGFDLDTGKPKAWFTLDGGKTMSAIGKMVGIGPGGIGGDIRPDGITTEFTLANGYLLAGGVRPDGRGRLLAYKLTGSDLALTAFTPDTAKPLPGDQINFQLTITNYGDNPREVTVRVRDNQTAFDKLLTLPDLPGHGSVTTQVNGWEVPSGEVTITAQIIAPPGGSKFNYNVENDTRTVTFANGIDLLAYNLTTKNPVYTGERNNATLTLENQSQVPVSTTLSFLLNNNPQFIPAQKVQLAPNTKLTFNFTWTAPVTAGQVSLKAVVNANRNEPVETDYSNNATTKLVEVSAREIPTEGGQLTISAAANPTKTKAGYGFEITATTATTPYVYTETHTKLVNGHTETYTDTHYRDCPGATQVKAVFPTGESLNLEPVLPLDSPVVPINTWRLPPNSKSRDKLRKHYIPTTTPDGRYLVRLIADGAGDNRSLTAQTSVSVQVEGSMYDDLHSRIID